MLATEVMVPRAREAKPLRAQDGLSDMQTRVVRMRAGRSQSRRRPFSAGWNYPHARVVSPRTTGVALDML